MSNLSSDSAYIAAAINDQTDILSKQNHVLAKELEVQSKILYAKMADEEVQKNYKERVFKLMTIVKKINKMESAIAKCLCSRMVLLTWNNDIETKDLHSIEDKQRLEDSLETIKILSISVNENESNQINEFIKKYSNSLIARQSKLYLEDFGFEIVLPKSLIDIEKDKKLKELQSKTKIGIEAGLPGLYFMACVFVFFTLGIFSAHAGGKIFGIICIGLSALCVYFIISEKKALKDEKGLEKAQQNYENRIEEIKKANDSSAEYNQTLERVNLNSMESAKAKALAHMQGLLNVMEKCNEFLNKHKESLAFVSFLDDKSPLEIEERKNK